MKVLFLYVSTNMCRDGDLWYYDEGLACVAACLRRRGHRPALRPIGPADTLEAVMPWIDSEREADTLVVFLTSLLFSAYAHDIPDTFPRVRGLKKATGLPTAFVGLWATLNAAEVTGHDEVDFVGCGEMEEALPDLCDALEQRRSTVDLENWWTRDATGLHKNPLRPLLPDLSQLPHPARDLLDPSRLANERDGILTVVAARGCPLDCTFCSNHAVRRVYGVSPKTYARIKTVAQLLDEIKAVLASHPNFWGIFFHDDIFAFSAPWAAEFFRRYPREVGLPFGCNLIQSQVTPRFVSELRAAGCRHVQIGIESADGHLRNEVLKKGIEESEIPAGVRLLHAHGIVVKHFALLGVPGEDRRRLQTSLRGFAEFGADMIQVQAWIAHEGTALTQSDREAGRIAIGQYAPGNDRKAWRLKFYFRWYHRYVALYRSLLAARPRHPILARLFLGLVAASIRLPCAPNLLLDRDWNGRRRWPGRFWHSRWIRRLRHRIAHGRYRRFWSALQDLEDQLAADYILPNDLRAPDLRGWHGQNRKDRRIPTLSV